MKNKVIISVSVAVVAFIVGFVIIRMFFGNGYKLPEENGETTKETVLIRNGEVIGTKDEKETENMKAEKITEKEIMVTNGVKHSIPLDEIVSGCPGKDCIPSIDNPVFESAKDAATWLKSDDIGISLSVDGSDRFYPYRILVTHEIVNDTINGKRVLITYCPLCFTGIVFDPKVGGERVEFGVSGKLWNSNLLMYDRKTDSLWSQVSAEAVLGEKTGSQLDIIPSDITKFGLWSKEHPAGESLSRNTGRSLSSYEFIPYGGDLTDIKPFFPVSNKDDRLPETAFVIGIVVDGAAKAYHFDAVKASGGFEDSFAGRNISIQYDKGSDSVRIFEKKSDGIQERLTSIPAFWFSWAATHPDTELFK